MSLIVNLFLDQSIVCPGDTLTGIICINQGKQDHLPLTLSADGTSIDSLSIEVSCHEHYTYEESTSSTDSDGNTTTSTRTVHCEHTSLTLSKPLQPTEPRTFSAHDRFLPLGRHHFRFAVQLPFSALCSFDAASEDLSWCVRLTRLQSNGRADPVWTLRNAFTVIPRLENDAPTSVADAPLVHASAKNHFMFAGAAKGAPNSDVEMHLATPSTPVLVDLTTNVDVEVRVQNNSTKTIHQLSLALVRISGNQHWCSDMTPAAHRSSHTGSVVCPQVVIHKTIEAGQSFSLPLSRIALQSTSWPRTQLASAVGATVFALFFLRLQAHVKMATDPVVNVPITVIGITRPVHPPTTTPLLVANKDESESAAAHVVSTPTPDGSNNVRVVDFSKVADDDDNAEDDFVEIAASDDTAGGDEDDNDSGGDDVAAIDLQGRTPVHEVPSSALVCSMCPSLMWGSVRVLVRGIANLPRKNILSAGSDPYCRADLLDWQDGRKLYSLRTAVAKNITTVIADDGGTFAGGVARNNTLKITVVHRSIIDRKIGRLQIAWSTLASLSVVRAADVSMTLPPPPPLPTETDTSGAPPATIGELETCGVWLPLISGSKNKNKKGEKPMVCVLIQRFA